MKMWHHITSIIKRGYVSRVTSDDKQFQIAQISYLGKTVSCEIISPYGLSVNLPENTSVVMFTILGDEANRAAIGYSQEGRFKNLKPGEVVVGNPKSNCYIKFDENGNIIIFTNNDVSGIVNGKINITVTGDVDLKANEVKIDATKVDLGVGGQKIARLGDQVTVGASTGTITSAGTNTSI